MQAHSTAPKQDVSGRGANLMFPDLVSDETSKGAGGGGATLECLDLTLVNPV